MELARTAIGWPERRASSSAAPDDYERVPEGRAKRRFLVQQPLADLGVHLAGIPGFVVVLVWLVGFHPSKMTQPAEARHALAGVATIHFGHSQQVFPGSWGGPWQKAAIAVEVTLQQPDLNKLVELQRRVLSMRRALVGFVLSLLVFPTIFFDQTTTEVPHDVWATTTQEGIALVGSRVRERADHLRNAILTGSGLTPIFRTAWLSRLAA